MNYAQKIRLAATTNNERGDLFTRLTRDLFFSLGYDQLELDVASPGREIDIKGEHRFERRYVVAECKAHAAAMGGAELNKFLGVLTRERQKTPSHSITGYFVSLGGFTGTAVRQELESGADAIILFDAKDVIEELQKSHAVVPLLEAVERSGQCAHSAGLTDLKLEHDCELLGHAIGYVWVIYYSQGKQITHFALIHADGTPLSNPIAKAVIQADQHEGGSLKTLIYIGPLATPSDTPKNRADSIVHYRKWLGEECGFIQLDGLPADSDLSATKLRLEKLFVPLNAILPEKSVESGPPKNAASRTRPIGKLLRNTHHLAILANPGGGKSTLLKRLATAYSFPSRRAEIDDGLPDVDWLPLYLRCRDLRDRAQRPLLELLHGIGAFANMDSAQGACFSSSVNEALRGGRALLLVDGLDEISDEGLRRIFAQNLRTFMAMFPKVAVIVTSRVAGYRDIAGVIAGVCQQVNLAPLGHKDVERLCVNWHREVVADTAKVKTDAATLAESIWGNPHLRSLVENPLLLTTLLVVKRSNGELPPTRRQLYHEAVRVLVRTWNVEGYAPLDENETLARLSYVACAMLQRGVQTISQSALIALLNDAGSELEAELQFATVSPAEFIKRIEYRSSILMQTGYQQVDGEFQPVYEFRHLTFQEYLAARGFVLEEYPERNLDRSLDRILGEHLEDEKWQEVISLAISMASRKADTILNQIVDASSRLAKAEPSENNTSRIQKITGLLIKCLIDEVTVNPQTLRRAILELCVNTGLRLNSAIMAPWDRLIKGKFGGTVSEVVEKAYVDGEAGWTYFDNPLSQLTEVRSNLTHGVPSIEELAKKLISEERKTRIYAALILMRVAFENHTDAERVTKLIRPWAEALRGGLHAMLKGDEQCAQVACWSLVWLGIARAWEAPLEKEMLRRLFTIWRTSTAAELKRKAAWALAVQPMWPRDALTDVFDNDCSDWLLQEWEANQKGYQGRAAAAVTVAWYIRAPWTDKQLVDKLAAQKDNTESHSNIIFMLQELGEEGRAMISDIQATQRRRGARRVSKPKKSTGRRRAKK